MKIGDSIIFLSDENPNMGPFQAKSPQTLEGTGSSLHLYVGDVDKAFQRAIDAGGKALMAVTDMFWGDRFGSLIDPYGHTWGLSTRTRDLTEQETDEGAKTFYAQVALLAQKKSA